MPPLPNTAGPLHAVAPAFRQSIYGPIHLRRFLPIRLPNQFTLISVPDPTHISAKSLLFVLTPSVRVTDSPSLAQPSSTRLAFAAPSRYPQQVVLVHKEGNQEGNLQEKHQKARQERQRKGKTNNKIIRAKREHQPHTRSPRPRTSPSAAPAGADRVIPGSRVGSQRGRALRSLTKEELGATRAHSAV